MQAYPQCVKVLLKSYFENVFNNKIKDNFVKETCTAFKTFYKLSSDIGLSIKRSYDMIIEYTAQGAP